MRNVLLHLLLGACAMGCATAAQQRLAAPPAIELGFAEFFVRPVGPRGLEPTARLLELNGQRVAIEGYMVEEEEPFPGILMLAPLPVSIAERADGPADFLPPATLFVHLPGIDRDAVLPHRTGMWRATGVLDLGAREEENGRVSYVRLTLEDLTAASAPEVANHEELKE